MNDKKNEFEKLLEKLENLPTPERTCEIDNNDCESCSG